VVPDPRVRDWAVVFGGDEEAHYRGRRFAPRVAVRLLRTRRPAPKEYDLWARAPVLETGPFVSCGGDEEAHYRGRRFAFRARAAVCLLCTQEPTPEEYDSWARAPVLATGSLFLVEMKGRTTAGGISLLVAVRLLSTRRPAHHLYDLWARAPVAVHSSWLGCLSARRTRFLRHLGARARVSSLKRDSPRVQ
jgi:hypothetical protein